MANNSPEWRLVDLACARQGFVTVPVYDSPETADAQYVIRHSDMKAIVCSEDKLPFITDLLRTGTVPLLTRVMVISYGFRRFAILFIHVYLYLCITESKNQILPYFCQMSSN